MRLSDCLHIFRCVDTSIHPLVVVLQQRGDLVFFLFFVRTSPRRASTSISRRRYPTNRQPQLELCCSDHPQSEKERVCLFLSSSVRIAYFVRREFFLAAAHHSGSLSPLLFLGFSAIISDRDFGSNFRFSITFRSFIGITQLKRVEFRLEPSFCLTNSTKFLLLKKFDLGPD